MQNCRQRRELHQFLRNPILTIFILQVSTISVYGYFAFALIGRQFPSMNENREMVDMYEFSPFKIFKPTIFSYFPIFTVLQFLFYGIFYFWIVFQLLIDHLYSRLAQSRRRSDVSFWRRRRGYRIQLYHREEFGGNFKNLTFSNIQFQIALLIVDDLHNQVPPVYCESLSDGIRVFLVFDFSSNFLIFIIFFFEILISSFVTRKLHPNSPTTHNDSIYESTNWKKMLWKFEWRVISTFF